MAILNGEEGSAKVEAQVDQTWKGTIMFQDAPLQLLTKFDPVGPGGPIYYVYEGPVMVGEKFYFANGKVRIVGLNWTPDNQDMIVDFEGVEYLNFIRQLGGQPSDYLT
jgi:hypothetical protein